MNKLLLAILAILLFAQTGFSKVSIETFPTIQKIRPDLDVAKTTLSIPKGSEYKIVMYTPKTHWLISTDFPVVENTILYTFQGYSATGKVTFKTMYPIRGEYQFDVFVNGKKATLNLAVSENPEEKSKLFIFLGVLFLLGVIGGQVFLRSSQAKTALKAGIACLFSIFLLSSALPQATYAHSGEKHEATKKTVGIQNWSKTVGLYTLQVKFSPKHAVVGKTVDFDIQVKKDGVLLKTPTTIQINTFHMEDQSTMFDGVFTSKTGAMKQTLQFFDGAETRTTFTVTSLSGTKLTVSGKVDVEGIAPPAKSKIKTMTLLSLLIIAGMGVGFFLITGRKS
ncbi:MAG: hypothetical protein ACI86H_002838, partial [bacterium]